MKAKERGYTQVLWLDGIERKYIEEVGTMNVFFKIGDKVVTPSLSGSILPGVTRDSVIELLRSWDVEVEETQITIDELIQLSEQGELKEAFGTGTAAVISPIGELNYDGRIVTLGNGEIGELTCKIYDEVTGIQTGKIEDRYDWTLRV